MKKVESKIRKINGRTEWRLTICYTRKDGVKVSRSMLFFSPEEATNKRNFFVAALAR